MTAAPTQLPAQLVAPLERLGRLVEVRALEPSSRRTFLVDHTGGHRTVVRLRPDAKRLEHEARATALAHAAGVGPEVIDTVAGAGALLTRFVPGEVLTAQRLADPAVLDEVSAALRRLHAAPVVDQPDCEPIGYRAAYLTRARDRGLAWDRVERAAEDRAAVAVNRLLESRHTADGCGGRVLCHGDPVPDNLVRTDRGVVLIDFEFAGAGEPAFDLANLAVTAELDDGSTRRLVGSYRGGPDAALLARVVDWSTVLRHAWYVWVRLGDEIGPDREHWVGWADRVRAGWAAGPAPGPGAVE